MGMYLDKYEVNPPLVHSQAESLPHQVEHVFNEPLHYYTSTIMGTFFVS
jgi:hypothetical protein